MPLRFFASDYCPFCRPVKYFLKANNIPNQETQIDIFGESKNQMNTRRSIHSKRFLPL